MDIFSTIWDSVMSVLGQMLPCGTLPPNLANAIDFLVGKMYMLNFILPVNTLLTIAIWVLFFEGGVLVFKFIKLVANFVRGSGG